MNRTYEVMFIVRPDMPEEEQDRLVSTLENNITGTAGTVKNIERFGKRRLAYEVRGFGDGIYVLLTLEGGGEMVHELERLHRRADVRRGPRRVECAARDASVLRERQGPPPVLGCQFLIREGG